MKRYLVLFFALSLISCTSSIKTDLKSLLDNPEKYKGKQVTVQTDLRSIIENPHPYLDRRLELSGFVEYYYQGFGPWGFFLKDKEGRKIICYERKYRVESWTLPAMTVRQANRNNEQITVAGKFQEGLKLELDWIEYQGQIINTDLLPPELPHVSYTPTIPGNIR